MLNKQTLIIIVLLCLGCLHALIFGFLEYPTNFLTIDLPEALQKSQTIALYVTAVLTASFSYLLSRTWGLKKVLIIGLFLYLAGMILFSSSHFIRKDPLVVGVVFHLATIFFGMAFSSVVVTLTTYIILVLPKHVGIGITVLFAFMNLGAMLSPILLNVFVGWEMGWVLTSCIGILIIGAVWAIHHLFFDPPIPKHLAHLRKGSLIWKEMHYRFGLFILAIILYGICENTFNLWGMEHLLKWLPPQLANEAISVFWLFLIIGQLLVLLPLHYFRVNRVFYFLVALMILSLILLPQQKHLSGLMAFLALGGGGCSACFPILLAMLELEIKEITKGMSEEKAMPFLEIAVALMFAGYVLGIGIVGTRVDFLSMKGLTDLKIAENFYMAGVLAVILLGITIFLAKSFHQKITSKF